MSTGHHSRTVSLARIDFDDFPDANDHAHATTGDEQIHAAIDAQGDGIYHQGGFDANLASGFREYTTGTPVYQYLHSSNPGSPRTSRRSTLADRPEIDYLLAGHRIQRGTDTYLPLDVTTIKILAQYVAGNKPLADVTLLKNLVIDKDIKKLHNQSLLTCVRGIGGHCSALVLAGEGNTAVLSNMIAEWASVLELLPNVKTLQIEA